jgi:hypothetical protein
LNDSRLASPLGSDDGGGDDDDDKQRPRTHDTSDTPDNTPPALTMRALFIAALAALAAAEAMLPTPPEPRLVSPHDNAPAPALAARQAIDPSSGVTTSNGTTMDMAAWDRETAAACTARLAALDAASNPSGTAICYNVPMLNNQTGRFLADLRLYRISDPTGSFAGVLPQNLGVGVAYNGARVLRVDNTTDEGDIALAARAFSDRLDVGVVGVARAVEGGEGEGEGEGEPTEADAHAGAPLTRRDSNPQLLQTYSFKGQIDEARLKDDMTEPQLEALVMPVLTLNAINAAGQTVTTNVSANEASFLLGVFADLTFQSPFGLAAEQVRVQQQRLAAGEIAFVLPGVRILMFPVGLIVTSAWLVIGTLAYGFGTYQRFSHAHSFRARQRVAGKQGARTF